MFSTLDVSHFDKSQLRFSQLLNVSSKSLTRETSQFSRHLPVNFLHKKNVADQEEAEEIFKPKKPIITYILIALNVIIFLYMMIGDNYSKMIEAFAVYKPYIVQRGQIYRLLTGTFLHANIFHLLFNCYALYVIGSQTESFMGKAKYLFIYLFSAISGSLLSITLNQAGVSIGASGAIFGLMGSLLYFGYHNK